MNIRKGESSVFVVISVLWIAFVYVINPHYSYEKDRTSSLEASYSVGGLLGGGMDSKRVGFQ
ncbi:MAG: hypothetical protein RPU34_06105 [Candidatus Sedimenticola sp. (ex Thyasira tokunagai)]